MATSPRIWLVTGASSGFGKSMTEFALEKGDMVVATLRKPDVLKDLSERYPKDKLLVLKVDVTNQADIDDAFARTKEVFGRLDVVFNNAGYGILGEGESTQIDTARALFDVNFWGAARVSQAAVKFFREVNEPERGGVLLQMSSMTAVVPLPGLSFYGASKQALEGFSESLAMEILPEWNIKICIVQSGAFETGGAANAIVVPEHTVYNNQTPSAVRFVRDMFAKSGFAGDPSKFVKTLYTLVEGGNMPLYLPLGQDTLERARMKVKSLESVICEAAPWSADLVRDDFVQGK